MFFVGFQLVLRSELDAFGKACVVGHTAVHQNVTSFKAQYPTARTVSVPTRPAKKGTVRYWNLLVVDNQALKIGSGWQQKVPFDTGIYSLWMNQALKIRPGWPKEVPFELEATRCERTRL